jgi:hypothetical protein
MARRTYEEAMKNKKATGGAEGLPGGDGPG